LATTALGSPAENEVRERVISGRLYQVLIGTDHGRSLHKFKTGGGATGTIRPSTSPRMPTSGFEVRRSYGSVRPQTSMTGCPEFERRGPHAGLCCRVRGRPPALLSRLLSKGSISAFMWTNAAVAIGRPAPGR